MYVYIYVYINIYMRVCNAIIHGEGCAVPLESGTALPGSKLAVWAHFIRGDLLAAAVFFGQDPLTSLDGKAVACARKQGVSKQHRRGGEVVHVFFMSSINTLLDVQNDYAGMHADQNT